MIYYKSDITDDIKFPIKIKDQGETDIVRSKDELRDGLPFEIVESNIQLNKTPIEDEVIKRLSDLIDYLKENDIKGTCWIGDNLQVMRNLLEIKKYYDGQEGL